MKKVWRYLQTYTLFNLAVLAFIAGLVLTLLSFSLAAKWVLGTVAIVETGPLLWDMLQDVRHGRYGIDLLAMTAIVFSVVLGQGFAAIVLVIMVTGGESLEAFAERRAHAELDALLRQAPQQAHVIRSRKTLDVLASEVRAGERIIIKPGEIVPVDAEITEGMANFDESNLTGESTPVAKQAGEQILSGAINIDGAVTAKALRTSATSQYQQIINLVRSAAASRAPFVRLAERYSVPFTLTAFVIAAAAWVVGGHAIRFLEVIVVATPCPLLLAAPIALVSGMARASKYGIIVKTGSALERLAEVRTIAFDKTGTLTTGQLEVTGIKTHARHDDKSVLSLAASLEQNSNHALAKAIVSAAKEQGVKLSKAKQVKEVAGQGVRATIKGQRVLVGNLALLEAHEVTPPKNFKPVSGKQTAAYVAVDGELVGAILLEDKMRPESTATLERLKQLGVHDTLLITGDHASTARSVAKTLGIKQMYAETLPGEKLQILEKLENRPVAFVGDGVNDAPSLTAADVGVALGARGSTAASESADIVVLADDIGHVGIAVAIAKRTFMIARQSIVVGIGLSLILMGLFATGKFSPLAGVIVQEAVDIVVILNALRAHAAKARVNG